MPRRFLLCGSLIILVLGLGAGLARLVDYSHRYPGTAFNPRSLEAPTPTYYYLDWRGDLPDRESVQALIDSDGVFSFGDRPEYAGRTRRDPLHVIQACLGLHDQLLDRPDEELLAILTRQVDWLVGEAVRVAPRGTPVWPHRMRLERYGLDEPWISALTQGQAISLLVRMATLTGDSTYAEWARRATHAFTEPGLPIVWRDDGGELFFEEYPCDPPSHVLNGCLFAWLGLWDFVRLGGSPEVGSYCLKSLDPIKRRIPSYELGNWTRYDAFQERPTSPAYQEIHAALAEAIYAITEDPFFGERASRWRAAARDPVKRTSVFFVVAASKLASNVVAAFRTPEPVRGIGLTAGELSEARR